MDTVVESSHQRLQQLVQGNAVLNAEVVKLADTPSASTLSFETYLAEK
jgi:hypothetical protein